MVIYLEDDFKVWIRKKLRFYWLNPRRWEWTKRKLKKYIDDLENGSLCASQKESIERYTPYAVGGTKGWKIYQEIKANRYNYIHTVIYGNFKQAIQTIKILKKTKKQLIELLA